MSSTTNRDYQGLVNLGRRVSNALAFRRSTNKELTDLLYYQNYQLSMSDLRKATNASKKTAESLFTNFEDVRLTDEERVYLNAAAIGDIGVIRMSLEESENSTNFNVNCVDFMGRNALHLAVDFENTDAIEMLLDKLSFECIEEALLHAISKGHTKIVRIIIEHPTYMAGEDQLKRLDSKNAFFRTTEKSQFSPDITPLILAAHYNNHEMVQMFLSRNHRIDKPHSISCQCNDCQVRQDYDSLKRSRSRLNAYRALASPAYMALSSPDPIMTTFELRQEMMKLAEVEKEFKREYLTLVEQCMNFACEMMDLCRGTQEVEAVISDFLEEHSKTRDPLGRLRLAIRFEEKKFVAHPNCQQYLTSIWYGSDIAFLQSWSLFRKIGLSFLATPLLPLFCIFYVILPSSNLARAMRCPAAKFATHGVSHAIFLILLAVATFGHKTEDDFDHESHTNRQTSITVVQYLIVVWIAELKHIYFSGLKSYLCNAYNILSWIILSLYIASYMLRFSTSSFLGLYTNGEQGYITTTDRFKWNADDPEIVSDVLFAVANVISFARTTYLMPAFEALGPLQISFTRMLFDIVRFMVLYILVLFAFMVGLHNLYWYYGRTIKWRNDKNSTMNITSTEMFGGLQQTLYSLFWSMFSQISVKDLPLKLPLNETSLNKNMFEDEPDESKPTVIVDYVGMILLAVYHGIIIIVLVNMLIAMMSHSFETIQEDCDVEWKFARTKLWLNYIDNGSTLPVPFNIVPTPHSITNAFHFIKRFLTNESLFISGNPRATDFIKYRRDKVCQEKSIAFLETSYSDIMQRLVRRYLFKMEREHDSDTDKSNKENVFSKTDENVLHYIPDYVRKYSDNYLGLYSERKLEFADFDDTQTGGSGPGYSISHPNALMVPMDSENNGSGRRSNSNSPPSQEPQRILNALTNTSNVRNSSNRRNRSSAKVSGSQGQGMSNLGMLMTASGMNFQLPQLDSIQRSQKILDMRLQSLQAQSDQLNAASGNARIKEEIEHLRNLTNENQKALMSIVKAVAQMQDQVLLLNNNMEQWVIAQASGQQIRSVRIEERRPFNRNREESTNGGASRKRSNEIVQSSMNTAQVYGQQGGSLSGSISNNYDKKSGNRRGPDKERDHIKLI